MPLEKKIVVTTGKRFTDIDGLACVMAYCEIPSQKPIAVIPGPLNQSITLTVRGWKMNYFKKWKDLTSQLPLLAPPPADYSFVIVDVSESEQFPAFVNEDKIIEIYDHHFGYEEKWRKLLGPKAIIEEIGACATLVWEELKKRKIPQQDKEYNNYNDYKNYKPNPEGLISPLAANLLYTAIASNTLNFQASITTQRDKKAFAEIKPFTNLPGDWIIKYFLEEQVAIYTNPDMAIRRDTKLQTIKGVTYAVGQLELWNSRAFIEQYADKIESNLERKSNNWFLTSPSIGEGRNYFYTKSESIKNLLRGVMDVTFEENIGTTNKLWLRKEILRLIQ